MTRTVTLLVLACCLLILPPALAEPETVKVMTHTECVSFSPRAPYLQVDDECLPHNVPRDVEE